MQILRTIVLVLALASLLKGVWCLVRPDSVQKATDWWLQIPVWVARQLAVLLVLGGVACIGLAVWQMGNAVVATVTILGTVFVLAGLVYFWPALLQAAGKPFGTAGRLWIVRAAGVLALVAAAVLFVVYLKSPTP